MRIYDANVCYALPLSARLHKVTQSHAAPPRCGIQKPYLIADWLPLASWCEPGAAMTKRSWQQQENRESRAQLARAPIPDPLLISHG